MFKNFLLVIMSTCLSLPLGEGLARLCVDPSDFLTPVLVIHPQFGKVTYPNSAGLDRWGFRNSAMPQRVDLLAIGDSFTYGWNATRDENWPSVVARKARLAVYNVSVGGWGPTQYLCSMKVYGRALKPKLVVIGIYLGNDIVQAAKVDYPCPELDPDRISADDQLAPDEESNKRPVRTWLSQHSVLYQIIKLEVDGAKWFPGFGERAKWFPGLGERKDFQIAHFRGYLVMLPVYPPRGDDVHRVGIAKTIAFLQGIREECAQLQAACYTVMIPSKEAVYYKLLRNSVPEILRQSLERIWTEEQAAIEGISKAFANSEMTVMDCSAELVRVVMEGTEIYPPNPDTHFNASGYQAIGLFVAARVTKLPAD